MFDPAFLVTIDRIHWFQQCGLAITTEVPFAVHPINSWREAMEACSKPEWENTTLEARNALTLFLYENARSDYRKWNDITVAAKQRCVTPLAENVWVPFSKTHSLEIGFVNCVQWDVLGAIMEHEYRFHPNRPTFFWHLLSLYQAGHFPCGWEDGEFPNGTLLVF